jgi:hypothetical protein
MRILYTLLLVGVTLVWSWTFVIVRHAIALYGVLGFLAARFTLAATALALYTTMHKWSPSSLPLFGYWLAGDRLIPVQILGAVLILSALTFGEVAPIIMREREKRSHQKGGILR